MKRTLCIVLALVMSFCICVSASAETNAEQYENAIGLLKENKYAEAGTAFAALGSYGDSPRYVMYCSSNVAGKAENYTIAVSNFTNLGDFLDSSLLAIYYSGLSWESAENYEKALEVLAGITLYRDVAERISIYPEKIQERDYKKADENEQAGNLEAALSGFKSLGDYKNSTDRAKAVQSKLDERDAAAAEKAKADAFAAADEAEQNGDFATAYDGFVSLEDYKNSKDRATAIKQQAEYAKGMNAISAGEYKAAYAWFNGLGDYEDSKEKAYALGIVNYTKLSTIAQGIATLEFHKLYGFVNFNEGVLIAPQWSSVSVLSDDRLAVCKDEKYAVINMSGNYICDYRWTGVSPFNEQGICTISSEVSSGWSMETVFGLMNKDGKVLASCEWSELGGSSYYTYTPVFADGRILVKSQDGKYGFLSETGSVAVRAIYDKAHSFSNGLAAVKSGSNWGYIDPNNKTVIDFMYQEAYDFTLAGTADVCKDGEGQIIDKEGTLLYFKSSGEVEQTDTTKNEAKELRERVVAKLVEKGVSNKNTCDDFVQKLLDGDTDGERAILEAWLDTVGWKVDKDIYDFIDHCYNTGADFSSIYVIAEMMGVK